MMLKKMFLVICAVFTALLALSLTAAAEITEEDWAANEHMCLVCSDVDFDGEVSASDARMLLRFAVEADMPTTRQQRVADADNDGEITSADARIALRIAVKLETLPEHFSTEIITTVPVTCANDGKAASLCVRCGLLYNEGVVPSPGHVSSGYVVTKAATCTERGTRETKCIYCNEVMSEETIAIVPHNYSTPKADCLKYTNAVRTCKDCGATRNIVLPPLGAHTYQYFTVTPVTCTTDGLREQRCVNCGDVLEDSQEIILQYGSHTSSEWTVTEYASCTNDGRRIKTCLICDELLNEEIIPREDHIPRSIISSTPSTCSVHGVQTFVCINCGNLVDEELPLLPHEIDESVTPVRVDATCRTEGSLTCTCKVCGEFTEIIAKKPHSYTGAWSVQLMPTCTKDGVEALYCNNPNCNELLNTRPLKADGSHHYEIEEVIAPTCTSAGSQKLVCSACGNVSIEVIAKLDTCTPRDYEEIFQRATATQNEIRGYFCKHCGDPIHSTAREIPGTMIGGNN